MGYEYQIEATMWLALDLMVARAVTRALTVEPTSKEDVEADVAPVDAVGRPEANCGTLLLTI